MQIYYRIKEVGADYDKFSIDRETGVIRSVSSFDREAKNEYYLTVVAEDGAPSDRPNHYPPGTPNMGEMENITKSCMTLGVVLCFRRGRSPDTSDRHE